MDGMSAPPGIPVNSGLGGRSLADPVRLHVDGPLREGAELVLRPQQAHYLGTVMRQAPGAVLRLFDGASGEWEARLVRLSRGAAAAMALRQLRPQVPEPGPVLVFAPLKRDATDLVVQKATELGAAALRPVSTARTVAARVNNDRLALIAAEAAEQCERLTVPPVHPLAGLPELLGGWDPALPLLAAIERRAAPPPDRAHHPGSPCGLLIGPEGGFTPAELDLLLGRPFVVPVSLGPRVLRADTAAIAGLARLLPS